MWVTARKDDRGQDPGSFSLPEARQATLARSRDPTGNRQEAGPHAGARQGRGERGEAPSLYLATGTIPREEGKRPWKNPNTHH